MWCTPAAAASGSGLPGLLMTATRWCSSSYVRNAMKSLRNATRACSTDAYQSITPSKLAVLSTTWANFCGEIRCEAAGRVRVAVATVVIGGLLALRAGRSLDVPGVAQPLALARTRALALVVDAEIPLFTEGLDQRHDDIVRSPPASRRRTPFAGGFPTVNS